MTEKSPHVHLPLLGVLPLGAAVNDEGHLTLGGCDTVELAREFGTPLYVFDEETLRGKCREFRSEFGSRHAETEVSYAAKAYLGRALAALLTEEEMGMEVVSGGELAIALAGGFPAERIHFHGNNKSEEELREALECGIGRVMVDNLQELELLDRLATEKGVCQPILLRLSPNVDPHTHRLITTGVLDSKFGIPIATGQAEEAVEQALGLPGVELMGLHVHLGSLIEHVEPYREAVDVVMAFAAEMAERHGLRLREFSPGGGYAIQHLEDTPVPAVGEYAEAIVDALVQASGKHSLPMPRLIVEPGRSIVGQAGVALYTVGSRKDIPGVRGYVSVDGGMGDNIRPAFYSARYSALVANRVGDASRERVTIAGKFCEPGDVLVRDVDLPRLEAGDLLAVAAAGAYCLAMASNYNAFLRPPIVMVRDGRARLVRRRETYDDLMACDVDLPAGQAGSLEG